MFGFTSKLIRPIQTIFIDLSCPVTLKENAVSLENEMKRLNHEKKFSQALDLFDKAQRRKMPRDQAVVQALKACTGLKDLQRGVSIYQNFSQRSTIDPNLICATLVHFYSSFTRLHLSLSFSDL